MHAPHPALKLGELSPKLGLADVDSDVILERRLEKANHPCSEIRAQQSRGRRGFKELNDLVTMHGFAGIRIIGKGLFHPDTARGGNK
jgi:hypothetical protein